MYRVKGVKIIGDFHIHSRFSIATSKKLIPEYLDYWAACKGIGIVGTGDCTHPGWLEECREKFEESDPGLFKLRPEYSLQENRGLQEETAPVRFIITGEISNIYKKEGKVRKVHNLVFLPGFEETEKFQEELSKRGNISSDGRPILGLSSRDLFEILLSVSNRAVLIPAHIWTPWFSVLGSKSGFENLEQCYEDLTGEISAVETGLSSDPPMNWICSFLDRFNIISNSDAHSPEKLGREANLLDTELAYDAIVGALSSREGDRFLGTVEFFPEEGKYHLDGHRKCGIAWDPAETRENGGICPVCGRPVTVGVLNRVAELADRERIDERSARAPYTCLIPLKELLSEILGIGPNSKGVGNLYAQLVQNLGPELEILLRLPIENIREKGGEILAEGVGRMRHRRVYVKEGFDGEFGMVRVFREEELSSFENQELLFSDIRERSSPPPKRALLGFDPGAVKTSDEPGSSSAAEGSAEETAASYAPGGEKTANGGPAAGPFLYTGLNPEQLAAVTYQYGPAFVIAGPGTGKTRTLTSRIAYLVHELHVEPEEIAAVTFTNKAAEELKTRTKMLLRSPRKGGLVHQGNHLPRCTTLHAFGLEVLRENLEGTGRSRGFSIVNESDRVNIIREICGNTARQNGTPKEIAAIISKVKQFGETEEWENIEPDLQGLFAAYEEALLENNCFDLDDLIRLPVRVLWNTEIPLKWMLVDEFQDINPAQYRLIKAVFPPPDSNIFVIGDPDQSIYGFRGADRTVSDKFFTDYPGAARFPLTASYRCPDRFLRVSRQVMGNKEEVLRGTAGDVTVQIVETETDKSEAEFIARRIEKMAGGLRFFSLDSDISESGDEAEISSMSEVAVLCRLKKQRVLIEKALLDHGIPYQSIDTDPLFESGPVRKVLDICRSIRNRKNRFLMRQVMDRYQIDKTIYSDLEKKLSGVSAPEEYIFAVWEALGEGTCKEGKEGSASLKTALQFAGSAGGDIDTFLYLTSAGTRAELYGKNSEGVSILTIHAAKGLEFETVFIPGCEEGIIPFTLLENRNSDVDEERRLLYVGMTRASEHLIITHAGSRMLYGRRLQLQRSPFLEDIDRSLLSLTNSTYTRKTSCVDDKQLGLF